MVGETGQRPQPGREPGVDPPGELQPVRMIGEVKEAVPLDNPATRPLTEPAQVRATCWAENRQVCDARVQRICRPHHAVPEAVGRGREFHGHERLVLPMVKLESDVRDAGLLWRRGTRTRLWPRRDHVLRRRQDVVNHARAHNLAQVVVDHEPLIVPRHDSPRLSEHCGRRRCPAGQVVYDPIVILQERQLELGHDKIFIVARVTNRLVAK